MRPILMRAAAVTVALSLLLVPMRAHAALLANGNFEDGPVIPPANPILALAQGSAVLNGWSVSNGVICVITDNYWVPLSGHRSVCLSDNRPGSTSTTPGSIQQTFASAPGAVYRFTFWMSGEPFSSPTLKHLRVNAGATTQDFTFDVTPAWQWDMFWTQHTLDFTASASTTTIKLSGLDATAWSAAVDSMKVELVSAGVTPNAALAFAPVITRSGAHERPHGVHARLRRPRAARDLRRAGPPAGAARGRHVRRRRALSRFLSPHLGRTPRALPGGAPGRHDHAGPPLHGPPMKGMLPMRSIRCVSLLSAALLLAPLMAHANCGAEGCPLVRDGFGVNPSRFAFDLRYQDVTQDTPWNGTSAASLDELFADGESHGEVELLTHTRSWVGEGRAEVNSRLRFTATLPWVDREHQHQLNHTGVYDPRFIDTWKFQGLGDAVVAGHFVALQSSGGTRVTLQGGVKLPTGMTHVPNETQTKFGFDSTLEPSARPGSGSTDWITGALLTQRLPGKGVLPLTGSVLMKFNNKGTDDFKVGNEVQAGLSGGYAPRDRFTLLAQVNYSGHGSDVSADPDEIAHTGMQSLYFTPGATFRMSPALSIYGLYQTRLWGKSEEPTVVATNHFLFGTTYSLGH